MGNRKRHECRITSTILEQDLRELYNLAKFGLGQAEQLCTLSVDTRGCLYATVQIPSASRGFLNTFG